MLKQVWEFLEERKYRTAGQSRSDGRRDPSSVDRSFLSADISGKLLVLERGVVLDVIPFLRLYRVALHQGHVILCTYATESTFQPLGTTSQVTIPPSSTVLVARLPSEDYGIILSVVPEFVKTYGDSPADEIISGANAGFFGDLYQKAIMHYQPPDGGGIYAWRDSMVDALPGDWVKFSRLGSSIFLNDFLVGMRVNEYCGVWLNYLDSLLRLAGLNYQFWTGGSEEYKMLFWKAFLGYRGYGYTIRSQLGARNENINSEGLIEIAASYYENPDARVSNVEPVSITGATSQFSRLPFHRVQEWEGVLGQGGMKWVINPVGSGNNLTPVAQQGTTASGTIIFQSRQGILLAKYPYITAPIRIADPDENYGKPDPAEFDAELNVFLQRIGIQGITGRLALIRSMHPLDIRNLLCNWEAQAGFYLLPKKFQFLRETEQFYFYRQKILTPSSSTSSPALIYIDPLGDILLQNGQGATIELRGGMIRISAPDGVFIDSGNRTTIFGKSVEVVGDQDALIAAKDSIHLQLKQNLGVTDPNTDGMSEQERRDLLQINEYRKPAQMFHLSSDGRHRLTGCLDADYVSTKHQRNAVCTTVYVGANVLPTNLPIPGYPVPWLYHVKASGKSSIYRSAEMISAGTGGALTPSMVDESGLAKIPVDVNADADISTVISGFPYTSGGADVGFSNTVIVVQ